MLLSHPLVPSARRPGRRCAAAALGLALTLAALPAAAQLNREGQRFAPVKAEHHMVVGPEALAVRIGADVMQRGGNAVDAAVATAFALAVTLPGAGNIGGGGFMVIHRASGENVAIDYRELATLAATRDMFLGPDGNADPEKSRHSGLAVGVPGTVAGLALARDRYGSGTLTLADLVAPAVHLARDGFSVNQDLAEALRDPDAKARLEKDPEAFGAYYPGGQPPRVGDTLRLPALAGTLEAIGAQGPAAFYQGEVAEAIAATVREHGGNMTAADLGGYEAKVREPVTGTFKDWQIVSMPPPSSGGVHLVEILNILEPAPLADWGLEAADTIHMMAEAMKIAYADRAVYLGDPDFVDVPVKALTSKAYADTRRAQIDMTRARPASEIAADPKLLPHESSDTTHFSVVDDAGNAVSNTYTLNFNFGVGFAVKGHGFLLNNELDDFSAKPGTPNAYGLIGGDANMVAPRKRPLSSMSPTIVLKDGKTFLVTGSPGGSRIITTVLQVILNATVHRRDVMTATTAPRIHHQWQPDYVRVEEGLSPDTIRILQARGHTVRVEPAMGVTATILVDENGVKWGAADPRRAGGVAAGD